MVISHFPKSLWRIWCLDKTFRGTIYDPVLVEEVKNGRENEGRREGEKGGDGTNLYSGRYFADVERYFAVSKS